MNPYILLTRQAIENYIKEGKIISLEEFSREELVEPLG